MTEAGAAAPSSTRDRGVRATAGIFRRGVRFYSAPPGQPRSRRAADVVLLVLALIGLGLLIAAYPPAGFESSLESFLASFPGWLDPVWGIFYDLLWLWALALLLAAVIARRYVVALQCLGSLVLVAVLAVISSRLAVGHWPDLGNAIEGGSDAPPFPAMRIAEAAGVIVVAAPHLVKPLQTVGRWILLLGIVGGLFTSGASPGGNLAGILVALVAAAVVRLASGTSAGRPGLSDVAGALSELGIDADRLEVADRQVAGVYLVRGRDASGQELLVKVYGRDAYDNQLIAKVWRTVWYRNNGPALGLSRGQAVEHEAFVTLLARNAGVPTREVVTAGETATDTLLVLRGGARPLHELSPDQLDDRQLPKSWRTLALLGDANVAHLQIDPSTIAVVDGDVGLIDFGGATVAPSSDQLQTDRVQLLVATAIVAGSARAVGAAVESPCGPRTS
jgi:hypothetical protein